MAVLLRSQKIDRVREGYGQFVPGDDLMDVACGHDSRMGELLHGVALAVFEYS